MAKVKKTVAETIEVPPENEETLTPDDNLEPEIEGMEDFEDQQELEEIENVVTQSQIRLTSERNWPPLLKSPSLAQFVKWRDGLNIPQLDHLRMYLYRTWPIINRKQSNPSTPKYIEVFSKAGTDVSRLNEDYIRKEHGGGSYDIIIQDTDKSTGKTQMVAKSTLEVSINECAPILVYDEVMLGHPRNKKYEDFLKNRGILDEFGNIKDDYMVEQKRDEPKGDTAILAGLVKDMLGMFANMNKEQMHARLAAAAIPDKEGDVLSKVVDMMSKGSDKAQEILMQRMREQDPKELLGLVTTMMAALKPQEGQASKIYETMMMMQQKQFDATLEILKAGKAESSHLKDTIEVMSLMREFFDVGKSAKTSTLETVLTYAPQILNPIAGMVANFMALRSGVPMQPRANPTTAIPAGVQPTQVESQPGENQNMINPVAFIKGYGELIVSHINRGTDGADLMDMLIEMFGEGVSQQIYEIVAQIGLENMMGAMKQVPEFWQRVSSREDQVRTFVDRFIRYPQILQEEATSIPEEEVN